MRGALAACLLLTVGSTQPVRTAVPALPEDLEASGYEVDGSGSGSGDWSEPAGGVENVKDQPTCKDQERTFAATGSSVLNSEFVLVENSRSFLENKDMFAAVIAGGAVGVALAAALAALLICAHGGGADHLRPNRSQVI